MVASRQLGRSGRLIPEIGLGTWDYRAGPEPLRAGLEAGAWFIDTAESYGTEAVVAGAIAGVRDRVFLATKVSRDHLRPAGIRAAADRSLRELRTDVVDLYQVHEPNEDIPFADTFGALEELVDAGKVRFIGVSNFSAGQLERAQQAMQRHRIVSNQVRYNLADRTIEAGLLRACAAAGVTVIAYSPLGRELRRLHDADPHGVLAEVAQAAGRTVPQVALNWCLRHAGVVVIPKGNSAAHILENCGASGWRLDPELIRRLDEGLQFRRRGRLEQALRRLVPAGLAPAVKRGTRLLPPFLRRRLQ